MNRFESFREFYPFYLGEHQNVVCRRLHFIGTGLVIATALYVLATGKWLLALLLPVFGYSFAWVGHFFFEHNRPATFKYPWMSYRGDWRMWREILTGRIPF